MGGGNARSRSESKLLAVEALLQFRLPNRLASLGSTRYFAGRGGGERRR